MGVQSCFLRPQHVGPHLLTVSAAFTEQQMPKPRVWGPARDLLKQLVIARIRDLGGKSWPDADCFRSALRIAATAASLSAESAAAANAAENQKAARSGPCLKSVLVWNAADNAARDDTAMTADKNL